MVLGALVEGLDVEVARDTGDRWRSTRVCDVTEDSRTVVPGSLFIARAGSKVDGKAYIELALAAGASAILCDSAEGAAAGAVAGAHVVDAPVLVARDIAAAVARIAERFHHNPSHALAVMGVTGTNGKTTVSHLVWRLLNAAGVRCGVIGTVQIDDGVEVAPAMMTTPPATEVSRTLQRMVEAGCVAAAMEVSSHSLDQKRVDALRFAVAAFTNLTGDHLDYHGTMERYAAAKARLFELLDASAVAVVNEMDPWAERMVARCGARVIACRTLEKGEAAPRGSTLGHARVEGVAWVRVVGATMSGMELEMDGPMGLVRGVVPLIGAYNAMNVLQAVVSCHAMGVAREVLEEALGAATAPPGRLEPIVGDGSVMGTGVGAAGGMTGRNPGLASGRAMGSAMGSAVGRSGEGVHVFVDYAHSDDSLANVLRAVGHVMPGRDHAGQRVMDAAGAPATGAATGRLWVVFGCGGDRDRTKRPRMGLVAARLADRVVVTSDNPRRERPSDIVDEILAGIPSELRHKVEVKVDRQQAIRHAIEHASRGDVVVIAGKGHEREQIISNGSGGTISVHFDDREVARTILAQRRASTPPGDRPGPQASRREPPGRGARE
jgi:UDP-N-acetylmuramoyl-L-alanyl-D-glutamate--2,6-diaminopimelate ligase